jgi:hypothetical protein
VSESSLIRQPNGSPPLGEVLLMAFADTTWTTVWASVAYVRTSGVKHVSGSLQNFGLRAIGDSKLVVGIDQQGSSLEALEELYLILAGWGGELFILRNPSGSPSPTFHPKLWYFTNGGRSRALLIAGSGNLTEGGLYTNYEVGSATVLDSSAVTDAALMTEVQTMFNAWTNPHEPHVLRVDVHVLQTLHNSGELPGEDTIRRATKLARTATARMAGSRGSTNLSGLFSGSPVPSAPAPGNQATLPARPVLRKPLTSASVPARSMPAPSTSPTIAAPSFVPSHRTLRMTVRPRQKTELYLTKGVLNEDPAFFGAPFTGLTTPKIATNPAQPQPDPLPIVSLTVHASSGSVVASVPVHALKMWTYSNGPSANDDFRLTLPAQMLQQVPDDTILVMERDPNTTGLDYALSFYPPGHPSYASLLALCTQSIPNSQRRYGWA